MKAACVVLAAAALVPSSMVTARRLRKTSQAPGSRLQAPGGVPALVVDVPVLVVDATSEAPDMGVDQGGDVDLDSQMVSTSCMKEMIKFQSNASRVSKAKTCENAENHTKDTIKALQNANASAAEAAAAETFHTCAEISQGCAKELGVQVVLSMRLSGIAVSEACKEAPQKVAHAGEPNQTTMLCQRNATQAMVKELVSHNMAGSLAVAQQGLRTCQGIRPPCDFQLAPLLLGNLLQAAAESQRQQVTEVLLAGLHAAQELSEELELEARAAPKPVHNATGKRLPVQAVTARKALGSTKKRAHKTISLIGVFERLRVTSAGHVVKL